MPTIQGAIEGGKAAIERGDTEWADHVFDSALKSLEEAREQTLQQRAEREAGTYDPYNYCEHWHETQPDSAYLDKGGQRDRMYEREEAEEQNPSIGDYHDHYRYYKK